MTVNIGENIRRLRLNKGLTQEKLAEALGVTFQSVSKWERGESFPDITLLPEISSFFKISIDELLLKGKNGQTKKINEYLELYDNMRLKEMPFVFEKFCSAKSEFPHDFRILVRYMQLLQEVKIRSLTIQQILAEEYKKPSEELTEIYNRIQNCCTDDSIRIQSKAIMISHLTWKYDCICNKDGKFGVFDEYLDKANEIIRTLPSICNSREIMALDRTDYYSTHKKTLEELIFHLYEELFGYCFQCSVKEKITLYESLQQLLSLIYPGGDYGKNCYNKLYNLGFLAHLYQQSGDDQKALEYLEAAALYAKELDKTADITDIAKRFYNHGTVYRETTAAQFMKIVITEHYPLTDEFKATNEFKRIIKILE